MHQPDSQRHSAGTALSAGSPFLQQGGSPPADGVETLDDILVELTESVPAKRAPVVRPAAALEPEPEPEKPTDLNLIFRAQRQMQSEIDALVARQRELERHLIGEALTAELSWKDQQELAASAFRYLVHFAQSKYAPPGGTLAIDTTKLRADVGIDGWENEYREQKWRRSRGDDSEVVVDDFIDLNKVAAQMEQTYGGDAGVRESFTQAAKNIIRLFGLEKNEAVTRTKSGVVLTARVWSRKKDYGPNIGMYEHGLSSSDRLFNEIRALATFLGQCELDCVRAYELLNSDFMTYHFAFTPREKRSFRGLEIAFFKEQWTFKFENKLAEQLMLFLGEYGQPA